jgi:hypothetical protein
MYKIVLSFLLAVCSTGAVLGQDSIAPPQEIVTTKATTPGLTGPKGISAQVKKKNHVCKRQIGH